MQLPVAPPEYVIVRKLQFYHEGGSEKHLRDISAMLRNAALGLNQAGSLTAGLSCCGYRRSGSWRRSLPREVRGE